MEAPGAAPLSDGPASSASASTTKHRKRRRAGPGGQSSQNSDSNSSGSRSDVVPVNGKNKNTSTDGEGEKAKRRRKKRAPSKNKEKEEVDPIQAELKQKSKKYTRLTKPVKLHEVKDRKLRDTIKRADRLSSRAALSAARAEMLLPTEAGLLETDGLAKTYHVSQQQIAASVDVQSAQKVFDLKMPKFAPYRIDYSRDGRYLAMAGAKGHIGLIDWMKNRLYTELNVDEGTRDIKFLHNFQLFAVAQKKYTYIYDNKGIETHCLKQHVGVNRLEYLPYHWLLVSVGESGWLRYQDTSTGTLVAETPTKLGNCRVMAQNPRNAVIHLGHTNGTVTLWTPNMTTPAVRMLCHKGPVQSMAISPRGDYLITSGLDAKLKVWDLRTYQMLKKFRFAHGATTLQYSQRGLLAVGYGPHVEVWRDVEAPDAGRVPYMKHLIPGVQIHDINFVPFEDVLGIGHSGGVSSMLVPGAGEPNFDTFEANPYETKEQRREGVVHSLLEKLRPEMIALDVSSIGRVDPASKEVLDKEKQAAIDAQTKPKKEKKKTRGRSSAARRLKKKQKNVIAEKRMTRADEHSKLKDKHAKQKERQAEADEVRVRDAEERGEAPSALDRFNKPGRG